MLMDSTSTAVSTALRPDLLPAQPMAARHSARQPRSLGWCNSLGLDSALDSTCRFLSARSSDSLVLRNDGDWMTLGRAPQTKSKPLVRTNSKWDTTYFSRPGCRMHAYGCTRHR